MLRSLLSSIIEECSDISVCVCPSHVIVCIQLTVWVQTWSQPFLLSKLSNTCCEDDVTSSFTCFTMCRKDSLSCLSVTADTVPRSREPRIPEIRRNSPAPFHRRCNKSVKLQNTNKINFVCIHCNHNGSVFHSHQYFQTNVKLSLGLI